MPRKLILFAKAPENGKVKTRLATHLSLQACADLHRDLVWNTLNNIKNTASSSLQCDIELHCSPSTDHTFFHKCAREFPISLQTQCGNDLGDRMHYALDQALGTCEQVVLIGTDCPAINTQYIESAFAELNSGHDLVLGPAQDGGYVLIGAVRVTAEIFQDIQWSTSSVLKQTLKNIKGMAWKHYLLPTMNDIDTYQDLIDLSQYGVSNISVEKYLGLVKSN